MGKPTGFLEYERKDAKNLSVEERIKNFYDFHGKHEEGVQIEQAARCMNCGIPFCQSAMTVKGKRVGCPLSNLIPEWNHLIYLGLYEEAYKRLAKTAPFPEFTGRVCPALCEACCSCSIGTRAVGVRSNELFLIEKAFENGWIKPDLDIKRNGYKAVIIGSGPSGLSVAKKLNDNGFDVTVLEKEDRLGGLLMYGIPNMKIEKSVIDRRIKLLEEEGIKFKTNVEVGKDISLSTLENEYDDVVFACGTSQARSLNVPGKDKKCVVFAVDFLKETTKNLLNKEDFTYDLKGKDVVIIGGGDTGNDCVATAVRLGAKTVTAIEITKEPPLTNTVPWPEYPNAKKTDYGIEEASFVAGKDIRLYETTVDEILGNDKVESLVIKNVEFKNGMFVDKEGSKKTVPCDFLVICMGFLGTKIEDLESFGIEHKGYKPSLLGFTLPSKDNVYVTGDMKNGQSLVVTAIKDGIDCADLIIAKHK